MNKSCLVSLLILLVSACEKPSENQVVNQSITTVHNQQVSPHDTTVDDEQKQPAIPQDVLPNSAFMAAKWIDLIPEDDLDALLNPPSYLDEIAENSSEDQLENTNTFNTSNEERSIEGARYHEALSSIRVIEAVNNVAIRIPSFIVPLEFDDEQRVTQFFMVPFFGACIHLPPPPNQTIFVNYPQGFKLESLTEAYWISGVLKTSLVENELATAAYSMEVYNFELYTDE